MGVVVTSSRRMAAVAGMLHTNGTTGKRTLYLAVSRPPWWDRKLRRALRQAVRRQVEEQELDAVMIDTPKGWRPYR